jgi:uncharacterized Zn finger protein
MPEDKKEAFVVCGSVATTKVVFEGSIKVECSECGIALWMSPGSMVLYKDFEKVTPFCLECGRKRYDAQKAETKQTPDIIITKESVEEIRSYFKQYPGASKN